MIFQWKFLYCIHVCSLPWCWKMLFWIMRLWRVRRGNIFQFDAIKSLNWKIFYENISLFVDEEFIGMYLKIDNKLSRLEFCCTFGINFINNFSMKFKDRSNLINISRKSPQQHLLPHLILENFHSNPLPISKCTAWRKFLTT